jgi:hypothetical protein
MLLRTGTSDPANNASFVETSGATPTLGNQNKFRGRTCLVYSSFANGVGVKKIK